MLIPPLVQRFLPFSGKVVLFDELVLVTQIFDALLSLNLFISILQMLMYFNFNRHISMMASTLRGFAREMKVFQLSLIIIFFSYLCFAQLSLSSLSVEFSTIVASVEALFAMSLGILQYADIFPTHQTSTTAIFFISFSSFVVFVIIIIIVSILNDSYATVKADPSKYSYDAELNEHMWKKVRSWWKSVLKPPTVPSLSKGEEKERSIGKF